MSVAFRRESDEEHLEPRFELPIPPGPNLVRARGYRLIEQRVSEFEARLAGDLEEEEHKAARRDLRYWRSRLASAQVMPVPNGKTVAFGTRVTMSTSGGTRTLTIVGHDESDPASGLVAFSAPLAKALLGAAIDEEVEVPGGADPVTITQIDVVGDEGGD
jgi:transcription elongation GreA/GreB family factor